MQTASVLPREGNPIDVWPFVVEREGRMVTALVFGPPEGEAAHLPDLLPHGFTIMHTVLKRPAALPDWTARADTSTLALDVETALGGIFYTGQVGRYPERFAYAAREWPWCWLYVSGPPVPDIAGVPMWNKLQETAALGGLVAARIRIEV